MNQIGFNGGSHGSLTRPEAMKDIVKLNRRLNPKIDLAQKRLPQHVNQPDTSELPIPFKN